MFVTVYTAVLCIMKYIQLLFTVYKSVVWLIILWSTFVVAHYVFDIFIIYNLIVI